MGRGSNECHGRFLGPDEVVRAAKELGAEFVNTNILEFAEASGIITPVIRHVMPTEIIARRVADRHPSRALEDAFQEPDGPRLDAAMEFERQIRFWHRQTTGDELRLHPLDNPAPEAAQFLESPTDTPWYEGIYDRVTVGRLPNGNNLTEDSRIPMYRSWQALMLMEMSEGTGRITFTDHASLSGASPPKAPEQIRLLGWHAIRRFREHVPALEAVAWHAAYSKQALQLAESEDRPGGRFIIRGAALTRLREIEAGIATEAFARYSAGRDEVLRMIGWAAEQALDYRRKRLPRPQEGYERLVHDAVKLLEADGMAYEEIEDRIGGGQLGQLLPNWLDGQVESAMLTVRHVVLPALQGNLPSRLAVPDEARARAFLGWLPTQGLGQVFWHFAELAELADSYGDLADAGAFREVGGMAASLEHVCNAFGATGNGLSIKAKSIWKTVLPGLPALVDKPLTLTNGDKPGNGSEAVYRESYNVIMSAYCSSGDEMIARDIRLAALVRNQILHQGITFLDRDEAIDLFVMLFRLSLLTWHALTP